MQGLVVVLAAFFELGHAQGGAFGNLGIRTVSNSDFVRGAIVRNVFSHDHERKDRETVRTEIKTEALICLGCRCSCEPSHRTGRRLLSRKSIDCTDFLDFFLMDMRQLDDPCVVQAVCAQFHIHRQQGLYFLAFTVHEGNIRRLDCNGVQFFKCFTDFGVLNSGHLQFRTVGQCTCRRTDLYSDISRRSADFNRLGICQDQVHVTFDDGGFIHRRTADKPTSFRCNNFGKFTQSFTNQNIYRLSALAIQCGKGHGCIFFTAYLVGTNADEGFLFLSCRLFCGFLVRKLLDGSSRFFNFRLFFRNGGFFSHRFLNSRFFHKSNRFFNGRFLHGFLNHRRLNDAGLYDCGFYRGFFG